MDGSVICVNGTVNGNGIDSCYDACDGQCCQGEKACDQFTGTVCKDMVSCSGLEACYRANIDLVLRGCSGEDSCSKAGSNGGSIGVVQDSCIGEEACEMAAEYGGRINNIRNSCREKEACQGVAGHEGVVEEIVNSCVGGTKAQVILIVTFSFCFHFTIILAKKLT